ncbi:MAG: HlyD family type I secretion periplasmic adaptor subunit [Pseudomonadota bacterium]
MSATVHQMPPSPPPPTPEPKSAEIDHGLAWRLRAGALISAVLIVGVGGWAAMANLAGAVIASGQIMVDTNIKKVQHPTGGVVGEIMVRNGDRVAAGDVVVRLDATQTRAALAIVVSQLTELTGRKARLIAERDGAETITFPVGFRTSSPHSKHVAAGETTFFSARRRMISSQKRQLDERIGQLAQEIKGLSSQRDAKARELTLVRAELKRVASMYERNLTPVTRVLAMQRDETRIAGEHGSLVSQIARAKGQIAETRLQRLTIDQTVQSDAQKELRDIEGQMAELRERKVAAEDQLKRIEIRAPQSGIVHELTVHTVGGVINAAEPLMLIVPSGDRLVIEIRVTPADIDQVHIGQTAMLRFSAFNQRTTPEVPSHVIRVGADLSQDPTSGESFYLVRVRVDAQAMKKLGELKLVPGMPVEVFIQTEERSALSYVVKPLTDQFARAFREE